MKTTSHIRMTKCVNESALTPIMAGVVLFRATLVASLVASVFSGELKFKIISVR
jgi:hypothetical protein